MDKIFQYSDLFGDSVNGKELMKIEAEALASIQQTADMAKACLSVEQFHKYKKQFQSSQDKIINVMIMYSRTFFAADNGDMAKYGAIMSRYMTKIEMLRMLLERVETDSNKKGLVNAKV